MINDCVATINIFTTVLNFEVSPISSVAKQSGTSERSRVRVRAFRMNRMTKTICWPRRQANERGERKSDTACQWSKQRPGRPLMKRDTGLDGPHVPQVS